MFSIYYVLNSKELYKLCLNMPKMMLKLELTSDLLQQTTEEYVCIFYIKNSQKKPKILHVWNLFWVQLTNQMGIFCILDDGIAFFECACFVIMFILKVTFLFSTYVLWDVSEFVLTKSSLIIMDRWKKQGQLRKSCRNLYNCRWLWAQELYVLLNS